MEQKFNSFSHLSDLDLLQNFCMQEGEVVDYQKGDLMEREGEPSNWFGFVSLGCFRYLTKGISDGREHITWFSFEGEFVGDYPCCLNGRPAQTTIEAMIPSCIYRIKGELLTEWFSKSSNNAAPESNQRASAFSGKGTLYRLSSRNTS